MPGTIVIRNALVYTGREVIEDGVVVLRNGVVERVGREKAGDETGDYIIDARGRLVTPGFSIAHTHIYSALARGAILKGEPARSFVEILEKLWWRLDRKLTLEQVELSALLYGAGCLRSGVTTIFDHHASFGAVRGSLDVIARALARVGLRGCLCFEVSDREGEKKALEAVEENLDFIKRMDGGSDPLLRGMFGLHASFTISEPTLVRCARAADPDEIGFHVHVAEDREDQERTIRDHGKRAVRRFFDEGILGKRTICSHCIWLEGEEVDLLARSGSTAAFNPQSNMNNAVGAMDIGRMMGSGVRVVLGTDGFTANIFREALAGQVLQSHTARDPSAGWRYLPRILMENNNALLELFFGMSNAALVEGARCDIVVWDYDPPTPLLKENFWGHAIFGLLDAQARDVIIEGKVVLREGEIAGFDEAAVMKECRAAAAALWKEMG